MIKVKFVRTKKGKSNTHYEIRVGMSSIGKIYIPNDVAENEDNAMLDSFEIELPFIVEA